MMLQHGVHTYPVDVDDSIMLSLNNAKINIRPYLSSDVSCIPYVLFSGLAVLIIWVILKIKRPLAMQIIGDWKYYPCICMALNCWNSNPFHLI